jgi:hypothetical protein
LGVEEKRMTAAEQTRRLLLMIEELHKQGYERLRISPGFGDSPGGPVWQCQVVPDFFTHEEHGAVNTECPDGLWYRYSTRNARNYERYWPELAHTQPGQAASAFMLSNMRLCHAGHGSDPAYAEWFSNMMRETKPNGVVFAGVRDPQDSSASAPSGVLSVFDPDRPDVVRYVSEPPHALIHGSDLKSCVCLVRKVAGYRNQAIDRPTIDFWSSVLQTYESTSAAAREYLRAAVKSNKVAQKTLLCDEVLAIGEGPYLSAYRVETEDATDVQGWLREVLCVISLTDGFDDSRDTIMFLAGLWRQAEESGTDPSPYFRHFADISSERVEHTICGPTKMMLKTILDPKTRKYYQG